MFAFIKPFLPRGLYGRAALILIVPVVTIQIVVSLAIIQRHFEGVTRQMTEGVVNEVNLVLEEIDRAGSLAAAKARVRQIAAPLTMQIELPSDWSSAQD